jgi:exonuclease SbcD
MTIDFLHMSDVHLGYRQYNLEERFKDFGRAFMNAVDYGIQNKVDFVLICGDLFHKSALDPLTLLQAVRGLERLEEANIKTIAIVGNHDKGRYQDDFSWLQYLAERGRLILLNPVFEEEGVKFPLYNKKRGGYVEIDGVQIFGVPFLGASISPILDELPKILSERKKDEVDFTILMAHFGLQGEIPGMPGGVPHERIVELKKYVDYFALGHWHKPFEHDDWIYNPGSLETCGMDERQWEGGFYHVAIDQNSEHRYIVKHVKSERRPFYRFVFEIDRYKTPETLYEGLEKFLLEERNKLSKPVICPVVEISLEGILSFDRASLDFEQIQTLVQTVFSPLIAKPKNNTRPTKFEISAEANLPRVELERQIFRELFLQDSLYQERADQWSDLALEIKNLVIKGNEPDSILSTLRTRIKQMEKRG